MRNTVKYISVLLVALVVVLAMSVPAFADSAMKGREHIKYNTRVQVDDKGRPLPGVVDLYDVNSTVYENNIPRLKIEGDIRNLPTLTSSVLGRETQAGNLTYNVKLIVFSKDGKQSQEVGKIAGTVPISSKNAYLYDRGSLETLTNATGSVDALKVPWTGTAFGKEPNDTSLLGKATKKVKEVKVFQSKAGKLVVSKYDVISFQDTVIGAGPGRGYAAVRTNGVWTFDYKTESWIFDEGFTITSQGKPHKMSGTVRWSEKKPVNGIRDGAYTCDIRFDATVVPSRGAEAKFFTEEDQDAFFTVDPTLTCVTGTIAYKDKVRSVPDDPESLLITESDIVIDLTGNKLGYLDLCAIAKVLLMQAVLPFNAE